MRFKLSKEPNYLTKSINLALLLITLRSMGQILNIGNNLDKSLMLYWTWSGLANSLAIINNLHLDLIKIFSE